MLANLNAEQRRKNWTDEYVAKKLNMSRETYNSKKNNYRFKLNDIYMLCELFNCTFEYLFAITETEETA